MLKYIGKRIAMMIPMLLIISALIFFGMQAAGVDPINYLLTPDQAASGTENVERLREQLGLNDPAVIQYFRWIGNILKGNLGSSYVSGTPISQIVANYLPATLQLSAISLVLSAIIGIGIGIASAIRQNGILDYVGRALAVMGQAIPQFIFGILILWIFSIKLGWFPASGQFSAEAANPFVDGLLHLVLPVATLTLAMCAVVMRYSRNTMLDVMNMDYIRTARSKGIPGWKVYIKHAFRNAMRPVLVILIFRIPMLVSGAVVIENVFSWPGIGTSLTSAITSGDYPVVMILALIIAAVMLVCSVLVDIITAFLDPRVRIGE